MSTRPLHAFWLGRRRYDEVHGWMQELVDARHQGRIDDTLLLLEHEPVITLGRAAKREHVRLPVEALQAMHVDFAETGRGGDVTYHGPGQLVAYAIVDLGPDRRDVRRYVADLTRVMHAVAFDHGIGTGLMPDKIGAWVDRAHPSEWPGAELARDPAKIGAIGVRISRWITSHGFALNISTELDAFQLIVPCGIAEYGVTSIAALTGQAPSMCEVAGAAARHFAQIFERELSSVTDLGAAHLDVHAVGARPSSVAAEHALSG